MNTEDDEFKRIEREIVRRALPDPIHHADTSESLEYVYGWNDCRQAMLAALPAQQERVADGLIRQYINSIVLNNPDDAATATKAMVDYIYAGAHGIKENT